MTADTSISTPLLGEKATTAGISSNERRPVGLAIDTTLIDERQRVRSSESMTPKMSGREYFEEVLAMGASPMLAPSSRNRLTSGALSIPATPGTPRTPGSGPASPMLLVSGASRLSPRTRMRKASSLSLMSPASPTSPGAARRASSLSLVALDAIETAAFADEENPALQEIEEEGSVHRNFAVGIVLANIATVSFSLQMLCVKLAAVNGPPSMQLLLVRLGIHTSAVLVCCGLGSFGYHGRFWQFENGRYAWLCAATGIFNMLVIQLLYYATTQLSLAMATVLYFTSPVWSGIWKTLLLRDEYSYADGAFSLLSVCAVCLVTLPHEEGGESANGGASVAGSIAALLSGALQALAYVIVQVLRRTEEVDGVPVDRRVHWLQINMSNAVFGAILCPLALWGPFKFQDPMDLSILPIATLLQLGGVGGFTVLAQFTLVQSQGHLDACLVTVIRTLDVAYATFYQSVFISHVPATLTDILGVALLVMSCAGSAWHSRWAALRLAAMKPDE